MLAAGVSTCVRSEDVLCLLSADAAPYTVAFESFRAAAKSATVVCYRAPADWADVPLLTRMHAPKLIFAAGSQAALKAAEMAERIPVLHVLVAEPAASQLAQRKGCFGVSPDASPALEVRTIQNVFPGWRKIGVIRRPGFESARYSQVLAAAMASGLSLPEFNAEAVGELNLALKRAVRESDSLLLLPDGELFTATSLQAVLRFSVANNYPVIGYSPQLARVGAPLAVYVSAENAGRYASVVAERVLAGRCAACGMGPDAAPNAAANSTTNATYGCSCEQKNVAFAEEVSYSVNLRACRHFRLTIGEDALRKADQVFGKEEGQ